MIPSMNQPSLFDVLLAAQRLESHLSPTPLEPATALGERVYLKLENVNLTHAFKIRGALNAMLSRREVAIEKGVVTASAGNHAQGLAYGAALLGANASIVMPEGTPRRKVDGVRRYGAEIIFHGDIYDDAEVYARQLETDSGRLYISPYNDPLVLAGQGTVGLEILQQMPQVERLLVPVGGGGLLGGVALAAKQLRPQLEVIGVQSVATPALHNLFYDKQLPQLKTLADGLAGDIEEGAITVPVCRRYVDRVELVEEEHIGAAIRWVFEQHGWVIEGAAAVGVAALLAGVVPVGDKPTAVIISGGNIDPEKFLGLLR
jgi:threonine dehydratase